VALAVDRDREPGRLPRGKGAQRGVDVDGVALHQLGLVGDPVCVGVEAEAGDPHEGSALHVRHVEHALLALDRQARRLGWIGRHAEHAREVVATPARDQGEGALGPFEGARERAQ
jgi:hypothetical protein